MKQLVECAGCGKLIRRYGSLQAEVLRSGQGNPPVFKERVFICRDCAREAGYKVKKIR